LRKRGSAAKCRVEPYWIKARRGGPTTRRTWPSGAKQRGGPCGGGSYPTRDCWSWLPRYPHRHRRRAPPVQDGEITCARALLGSPRAGVVLLADQNFDASPPTAQITSATAGFLTRVRTWTSALKFRPALSARRTSLSAFGVPVRPSRRDALTSPQRIDYYDSPTLPRVNSIVPAVNVVVRQHSYWLPGPAT